MFKELSLSFGCKICTTRFSFFLSFLFVIYLMQLKFALVGNVVVLMGKEEWFY